MSSVEKSIRIRIQLGNVFAGCCLLGLLIFGYVGELGKETLGVVVHDPTGSTQNAKLLQQLHSNIIKGDSKVLSGDPLDGVEIVDYDENMKEAHVQQRWRRLRRSRNLRFFPLNEESSSSTQRPNPVAGRGFFAQRTVTPPVPPPVTVSEPVAPTPAPVAVSENPVPTAAPITGSGSSPSPAPVTTSAPVATSTPAPPTSNVFDHNSPQAAPTPAPGTSSFETPKAPVPTTPVVETPEPTVEVTSTVVPAP